MNKFGFIGCGNMGGTLCSAVAKSGAEIFIADRDSTKTEALENRLNCKVTDAKTIASECDFIVLGVKPQMLFSVLNELSSALSSRTDHFVLISMAAGIKISSIRDNLGCDYPIIRIMPNTPAEVGKGMILYTFNSSVDDTDINRFLSAFEAAGELDEIPENLIDAASAVSGCGPAFVYMFIEALADGGVKCGLPREKALRYAAATVEGAAKMVLETNRHPAELKDAVCSPAGSTIEGVRTLEVGKLRGATVDAVAASFKRTQELGKD